MIEELKKVQNDQDPSKYVCVVGGTEQALDLHTACFFWKLTLASCP
jgi:hypothetical protein